MNAEQLHRDIGRLEGQVEALREKVDSIAAKQDIVLAALHTRAGKQIAYSSVVSAIVAFATAWFVK